MSMRPKSKVKLIEPKTVTLSDLQYQRIRECLVELQSRLEGTIRTWKIGDPHKNVMAVADVLKETARNIQYYISHGKEIKEMERRCKENDSRPCFVFECQRCHWQFFADKAKHYWCDSCKSRLAGAGRIGKPVRSRNSAQFGVVRHNMPLFKRERKAG